MNQPFQGTNDKNSIYPQARRKFSLPLRITNASFIIIIIIIISLTSPIFIWFLGQDTQKNIEETAIKQYGELEMEIAGQVAVIMEKMISGLKTELEITARIPAVRDIDPKNCTSTLEKIYEGLEPKIFNLGRVNKEGVMVCSVTKETIGRDVSKSAHIAEVLRTKKTVIGRMLKNQTTGEYLFAIHVPVFSVDGEFTGTLGGAINLSRLKENYFQTIAFAQRGYIILQDDNGDMLYHPDPELLGRNLNDEYMRKVLAESKELQDLVKESQAGLTGTKKYIYKGEWKLAVYKPAHIAEGRYWPVLVTVPEKEIKGFIAPVLAGFQYRSLAITAILLLFASGFIISLRQRGKILEKKVQERTRELEDARVGLEARVQERTRELRESAEKTQKLNDIVQDLRKTEKAMLNLLEDEKELEKQLAKEKAGVEQRVVERTKQLQEEHSRLEASINSLNLGFMITDTEADIIMINDIAKHMICVRGAEPEQTRATKKSINLDFACTINDIEHNLKSFFDIKKNIDECIKNKKPLEFKDIFFRNHYLHIFLSPILMMEKMEAIGCAILIEDTTEEKILQRSREEFFAIASHELRTPLTAIRGNMALIKEFFWEKLKNPEIKEMIDDSYNASLRLIGIVNDFLDVSRLEQSRVTFQKDKINVAGLIQEVVRELATLAQSKNLSITFTEPETPLWARADRDRTKQVIYNFLSNALNYTHKGGVTIETKKEDGLLKVFVTDTGIGISPANQALLFRKFQQAEEKILARDITRSTGLGLYISKLIIEAMGGRVWLEQSELGRGSVFAFALPAAE